MLYVRSLFGGECQDLIIDGMPLLPDETFEILAESQRAWHMRISAALLRRVSRRHQLVSHLSDDAAAHQTSRQRGTEFGFSDYRLDTVCRHYACPWSCCLYSDPSRILSTLAGSIERSPYTTGCSAQKKWQ